MELAWLRSVLSAEARHCRTGGAVPAYGWGRDGRTLVQAFRSDDDWREAQACSMDAPGLVPLGGLRDPGERESFFACGLRA